MKYFLSAIESKTGIQHEQELYPEQYEQRDQLIAGFEADGYEKVEVYERYAPIDEMYADIAD